MNEETLLSSFDRVVSLLDEYDSFLTKTQLEMLEKHFRYDLSLFEIAEEKGISRAAVSDALNKGIAKLESCEEKLHLLERKALLKSKIETILGEEDDKKRLDKFDELGKDIIHGI